MKTIHSTTLLLAASVAMLATLGACKPNDERTAGQKVDSAISKTEQMAERAKEEAKDAAARARAAMDKAADETRSMGAATADKVDDATLTARVKEALAADKDLSAVKIDVDTRDGKVTLSGPVPSTDIRVKASAVAYKVKGVSAVNNELKVKAG